MANILDYIRQLLNIQKNDPIVKIDQLVPYDNKLVFAELISRAIGTNDLFRQDTYGSSSLLQYELDRIKRYLLYRSVYRRIPQCRRAIKVIVANILSPDTVSKRTIDIVKAEDIESDQLSVVLENCKILSRLVDFTKKVRLLITGALINGDYFVLVTRLNNHPVERVAIQESNLRINLEIYGSILKDDQPQQASAHQLLKDLPNHKSFSLAKQAKIDSITKNLQYLYVKLIEPERVITLTIEGVCFGYLLFPRRSLWGLDRRQTLQSYKDDQILSIVNTIINKIQQHTAELDQYDKERITNELAAIFQQFKIYNNDTVQYIPPENMIHFKVESPEYEPYGESVFAGVELDAKILVALKTALAIFRINHATERRVVNFEIGIPRNATEQLEELKRTLRMRRVTLDSIGTLDAIPSTLGTFEILYVPMMDGRRFVEFDRLDPLADLSAKVDELKQFRDNVISGMGVPPLFLGVDEVEKKATASHQNILFTRDIVDYQEMFTRQANEFLYKLYKAAIPNQSDWQLLPLVTVHFPPPKNLQIDMTSELVNNISSMIQSLKELGIPQDYLVKEFLSNLINLDEVEEYKIKEQQKQQSTQSGGMGGAGTYPTGY